MTNGPGAVRLNRALIDPLLAELTGLDAPEYPDTAGRIPPALDAGAAVGEYRHHGVRALVAASEAGLTMSTVPDGGGVLADFSEADTHELVPYRQVEGADVYLTADATEGHVHAGGIPDRRRCRSRPLPARRAGVRARGGDRRRRRRSVGCRDDVKTAPGRDPGTVTSTASGTHAARPRRAAEEADAVAVGHGVRVATLSSSTEFRRAAAVLQEIWQSSQGEPMSAETLVALDFSGNYVTAAFVGDEMVGVAAAFRTDHRSLHSHIAGVLPQAQGRSVGFVLKMHQRAWALEQGITDIGWTFDPLVRRNAHFNLVKLGARAVAYLPDFYGEMKDAFNPGDISDRLFVEWDLAAAVPGAYVDSSTATPGPAGGIRRRTGADRGRRRAADGGLAHRSRRGPHLRAGGERAVAIGLAQHALRCVDRGLPDRRVGPGPGIRVAAEGLTSR